MRSFNHRHLLQTSIYKYDTQWVHWYCTYIKLLLSAWLWVSTYQTNLFPSRKKISYLRSFSYSLCTRYIGTWLPINHTSTEGHLSFTLGIPAPNPFLPSTPSPPFNDFNHAHPSPLPPSITIITMLSGQQTGDHNQRSAVNQHLSNNGPWSDSGYESVSGEPQNIPAQIFPGPATATCKFFLLHQTSHQTSC